MLHNKAVLTVEKCADAWYYIDTARETTKTDREENKMLTTIIGISAFIVFGILTIYVTYKICTDSVR